MTSKRSSSVNKKFAIPQKEILRSRRWTIGLSLMLFIMYFVVVYVITLVNTRNDYFERVAFYSAQKITYAGRMSDFAANYLGNALVYVITTILAIVFAVQGFLYLHNRRAVDFYESQPLKRSKRFFGILLNSTLIYLVSYAVTLIIGILLTAAFGGMNTAVLAAAFKAVLVNCGLFFACFATAALASMLCGNVIITLIITAVLFCYEPVMRYLLSALAGTYFRTYYSYNDFFGGGELISPFVHVFHEFGKGAVWHNLVYAVIVTAIAYFCYTKRKNESAGSSVVFPVVRTVIKIAVAALAGIMAGFIFANVIAKGSAIIIGVITALIIGCIIEIIYNYSFSKLFRHWWEIAVAAALTVFVILTFQIDLFGYDNWSPDPEKVESAAVRCDSYYYNYFDKDGNYLPNDEYYRENMFIKDTKAVCTLMEACKEGTLEGYDEVNGYDDTKFRGAIGVMYRMKDGRTIARQYLMPVDLDPDVYNNVFGNEDFKKGYYPVYNSEYFENEDDIYFVSYYTGQEIENGSVECDWFEIKNAYLKDLEKLDYKYAAEHPLIGNITVTAQRGKEVRKDMHLEVYDGFDNTISVLKKCGVYEESVRESYNNADKLTVFMYYWDEEGMPDIASLEEAGLDYNNMNRTICKEYTDPEEIKAILDASIYTNVEGTFSQFNVCNDYLYISKSDDSMQTMMFRAGEVPEFVEKAFSKYIEASADQMAYGQ